MNMALLSFKGEFQCMVEVQVIKGRVMILEYMKLDEFLEVSWQMHRAWGIPLT